MGITQDPEKSGLIANLNLALKEQNYYIYMVVGNVLTLKEANTTTTEIVTSKNDTLPLFTGQYFDFIPNHVSWLKAGSKVSADLYTSAYSELIKILKKEETKYGEGFKVIEEKSKTDDIDYSEYWIINQEEQTFRTPLKTSLLNAISNSRILINKKEPTDDDPSGYNLYSDGWLEQGGIEKTAKADYARGTVIFPKSYKDTNYTVKITQSYTSTTGDGPAISNKTTQTITWSAYNSIGLANWQTEGYAELPTVEQIANSENIGLYFKVANALENQQLLDAGQLLEDCVLKTELKPAQTVIDTYKQGASGYRVWSDGYCEQWGRLVTNSDTVYTVNLLKEMEDTNYLCLNSRGVTGAYRSGIYGAHDSEPFNFTTKSFDVYGHSSAGINVIQWKTEGYLKMGTY